MTITTDFQNKFPTPYTFHGGHANQKSHAGGRGGGGLDDDKGGSLPNPVRSAPLGGDALKRVKGVAYLGGTRIDISKSQESQLKGLSQDINKGTQWMISRG